ncbi:MAG TPA: CAP domain-containing protein [Candidatus Dormibacteraeota bacterium]|nr:CAP domain-containing protein [Candidatus Dormibacteraeota bacterium]
MRKLLAVCAALLLAGSLWPSSRPALAASADVSVQQTLINQDRAAAQLAALTWSSCLAAVAVQNAERIMTQGYLSHTNGPTLDLGCGQGATQGGENIAYMSGGINDAQANSMFMNSPPHKANILGPYQYVATAWSVAPNGYAYIAEEFLGASATVVPSGYHPLPPARILDTRTGVGGIPIAPLGPNSTLTVTVVGQGGVPATGVGAVVMNVTVTNTSSPGYLTVFPAEDPRPTASNLNWIAGQTVPNLVQVAVRESGQLTIYNAAGWTNVIFDVAGYVPLITGTPGPDGFYNPLVSARLLDTRTGTGALLGGQTLPLQVTGRGGVPSMGVAAVVLNVTVTAPTTGGYVTVFPAGAAVPLASNLNFTAGQTVPNRVIVKLGAAGQVAFFNSGGSVQIIADVSGWFTDASIPSATGSVFTGVTPVRILDTRSGIGGFSSPVGPAGTIVLTLAGWGGVPLMTSTSPVPATAVVLNVTAVNPSTASYLTLFPDGAAQPSTSDLNFMAGQTIPNLVVVRIGANGNLDFFNAAGTTDVIADVVGWYG